MWRRSAFYRSIANTRSGRNFRSLNSRAFSGAATPLHEACCDPLVAPWGEHAHALTDVNQAICAAIRITGREAKWNSRSSTGPARVG